jgi:hypothetical protein
MINTAFDGTLFTTDFLHVGITKFDDSTAITDADVDQAHRSLSTIFASFPTRRSPNEAQTEDDLIWKILAALNWTAFLRQQNLAARGREDVPDGLLFKDSAAKAQANKAREEWRRYEFGLAIVESKRWNRPLDRRSGQRGEETPPAAQMVRYLRRVDDLTTGKLRWGILTNGARWRLYYQGAKSVSENFFEIDLAQVLGLQDHEGGLFALDEAQRRHALRVFLLIFGRDAFIGTASDPRTFHQRALDEGRFYEERVATNLSGLVFESVFPTIVHAIAKAAPDAPLQEVRDAALILLYRLLFILFAEDRDLLPVGDRRYDDYGLRDKVRRSIGDRKTRNEVFSDTAARYWAVVDDLARAIDKGDGSIGLPPYNGGLFDRDRTPLLTRIRLPDSVMADVIDALSFERSGDTRRYINYRDMSVQQLGSIYERLLEHEVIRENDDIAIRPNLFARKSSGSYYTPDDLVKLIIGETLQPLIDERLALFHAKVEELQHDTRTLNARLGVLKRIDPAERMLELKICDPAMGSGHFLVSLVDFLADQINSAMAEAEATVPWGHYASPLAARIDAIRNTILRNAEERGWTVKEEQLNDRHIIRRMILKRCVYGVDKNPMAVELAKVSLWLHTFTVGAPLSFLDHHLRCGDSLFGLWVKRGLDKAALIENGKGKKATNGQSLFLHEALRRALRAASSMQIIEGLTDAEIAEAHRSADVFAEVQEMTAPLSALLSLLHALDWLELATPANKSVLQSFFSGLFGDAALLALGKIMPSDKEYTSDRSKADANTFTGLLAKARNLISEERFLNWQVAFPGVWSDWESDELAGGFDAVIGNPPWDRLKLQQVEWFAARRLDIAKVERAAERKKMIEALQAANDPLAALFAKAEHRAQAASRVARSCGDYPLLSGGDTNFNSLFVEQAARLCKPDGVVGLLVPSGISTETASQAFFSKLIENGNAKCVYDFFNKRANGELFFPDVYYRFKFSAFVFSPSSRSFGACRFATFVRDVRDLNDDSKTYTLGLADFAKVNPNTRTAPVYKDPRDKTLSTRIYDSTPILVRHSAQGNQQAWPIKYVRQFDMANDSALFRTQKELEEREGAYPVAGDIWRSPAGDWVPLYEGKMVQAFDHRASSITTVEKNVHRPGQSEATTLAEHQDPAFLPEARYHVLAPADLKPQIALKDITSTTNSRSIIACIIPPCAAGHTLPLIQMQIADPKARALAQALLCANLNSIPLDFVARTKILSNHASWFIMEQLPVIAPDTYSSVSFGKKTAEDIVRDAVLELTYTAHDLVPFARDLGYVDAKGKVKPPFTWDERRRFELRAKLDAVFFHLYGVTKRDDVRYVYSTFPIVEEQETTAHAGRYLSLDLCLAWISALKAGDPDAQITL